MCNAWWVLLPAVDGAGANLGMSRRRLAVASSLTFASYGASSPAWGLASDSVGRRPTLVSALAAGSVACVLQALARDARDYAAARAGVGVALGGVVGISVPYLLELVPAPYRGLSNKISHSSYVLATALLALASTVYTWRELSAAAAAAGAVAAFLTRLAIPESPLLEARPPAAAKVPRGTFRTKQTVALVACWCTASILYFASSYADAIILAIAEIPAYAGTSLVVARLGRRGAQVAYFSAAASAYAALLTPRRPSHRFAASLVARFATSGAFAVLWQITVETYPAARAAALGLCGTLSKTAAAAAPLLALLDPRTYAALALAAALLAALLTLAYLDEGPPPPARRRTTPYIIIT
ncbi:hypothetical protein CTAYLR_004072 [Chrysophaeum taylorii]|uniref:Major facilitator superfamily (MFS) profile domain-containing protein n=1 Tax=Chrysophaeum taylorii TaxID=2483200 RepID=A0AAD7UMQ2_9STRA|nr:hypothetical protein CTAYLR_010488 [Chrysophaeum taylorii]KAJ8613036.1 hypothetical protein CTAYLR_004072 [Chrysophaeum taylorii]